MVDPVGLRWRLVLRDRKRLLLPRQPLARLPLLLREGIMAWTGFVDLELDDEDQLDAVMPIPMPNKPRYPYGMRICLTQAELDKLKLDSDCNVGDMIDLRAFAEVTSISKDGDNCRVELQIQKIALEDESKE